MTFTKCFSKDYTNKKILASIVQPEKEDTIDYFIVRINFTSQKHGKNFNEKYYIRENNTYASLINIIFKKLTQESI